MAHSLVTAWRRRRNMARPLQVRAMPIKPNGHICSIREQIVEDPATGLILQFECENGRTRLLIAGAALALGNREIIFDADGREAAAGTLVGEFRRPSWLRGV
ncbi:MAG: hypothetical protein K0S03_1684 [Burkholderiales bacterium]|nr:hypothetical protein [Burkholderiales bacterium]